MITPTHKFIASLFGWWILNGNKHVCFQVFIATAASLIYKKNEVMAAAFQYFGNRDVLWTYFCVYLLTVLCS